MAPNSSEIVAIDCEMVETQGKESMLARVAIVDASYKVLLDTFVKPTGEVIDYRTWVSGVRPENLINAPSFESVQKKIKDILNGKIVVGFDLKFDFRSCQLRVENYDTRDIRNLPQLSGNSLKELAYKYLNIDIQRHGHNPVEDATSTMKLYKKYPF